MSSGQQLPQVSLYLSVHPLWEGLRQKRQKMQVNEEWMQLKGSLSVTRHSPKKFKEKAKKCHKNFVCG